MTQTPTTTTCHHRHSETQADTQQTRQRVL